MLSFDAVSNDTLYKSLTVNVVNEVSSVNFGVFLDRFYDSLLVIKLSADIAHGLLSKYHIVNYGNKLGNYIFKDGVMFHIMADYFGVLEINSNRPKQVTNFSFNNDPSAMVIDVNTNETIQTEHEIDISKFSMKPPSNTDTAKEKIVSPEQVSDPFKYIKQRYYNLLYSPTIPLSYFPKTAISRLRVIANDKINFRECLLKTLLSQRDLNERHAGELGLLKQLTGSLDTLEKDFEVCIQKDFIYKEQLSLTNKTLVDVVFQLKLRESQLQLIILLEILISLDLIEEEFLIKDTTSINKLTTQKSTKKVRPSLIRKKNKPRKIIPTFLGMGVGITTFQATDNNSPEKSSKDISSSSELLDILNNLIERLRLLDSLSTDSTNTLVNFVAYVLVPYYKNKLPATIKYIVERIKESTLKIKDHKEKDKKTKEKDQRSREKDSKSRNRSSSSSRISSSSFSRNLSSGLPARSKSTIERPRLTLNDQTFAPQILKRSNSNLSSKNLQRRQVDLSNLKSKSMTELNSSIFGQSRKKSTTQLQVQNAQSVPKPVISQVAATPMKPKRPFPTIIQTPSMESLLGPPIGIPSLGPAIQVNQTPMRKPSQQTILLSPIVSPVIQRSKILSDRRGSSSQYGSKLGDDLSFNSTILSSPVFAPNKRPGEPVEFINSEFGSGSPTQNSIFTKSKARKKS